MVSAVAPSLLIVWYIHKRDVYPEPGRVLWATFGLGVLTVIPVIPIELVIASVVELVDNYALKGCLDAFFVAAIPEESFKLLVLLLYCYRHKEFDEPMDGVVYGVVASLGFATLENVLYVSSGGIGVAVMRALSSVPSHAAWGAVMGYFVGRAKYAHTGKVSMIIKGFVFAVILHGLYDFPLLSSAAASEALGESGLFPTYIYALLPITLVAIVASLALALLGMRKLRKIQLRTLPTRSPEAIAKDRSKKRVVGAIEVALGFLFAGIGGMVCLALLVVFATGSVNQGEVQNVLLGGAFIGVPPLALGVVLFGLGINNLNQPAATGA